MLQGAEKALLRSIRSVLALGTLSLSAQTLCATLTVNTTSDTRVPGATCSLRKAIENANTNATLHPECPPAGDYGADTIVFDPLAFPPDHMTTSTLSGQLYLTDASTTTIDGGGVVALDGGGHTRIFLLSGSANLEGLTISNGYAADNGGGMLVIGTATIDRCTFTGNVAQKSGGGAIFRAAGQLTVKSSTLIGNGSVSTTYYGGAIYSTGPGSLTVIGSTLSNNKANGYGGAIDARSQLTVKDSLISGNHAYSGGGIRLYGHYDLLLTGTTLVGNVASGSGDSAGGGIAIFGPASGPSSTPVLTNDTFYKNLGGLYGGAIFNGANSELTVTNSTIVANMPTTIRSVAPTTFLNSILVGASLNCIAFPFDAGVVDAGGNIENGDSCGFTAAAGSLSSTDPKLVAPPSNNGGPTPTLALAASSPAFHFAFGCPSTDQRGMSRPSAACDTGAFEETLFFSGFE